MSVTHEAADTPATEAGETPERTPRWSWPLIAAPAAVALAVVPPSIDGEADVKLLAVALATGLTAWYGMAHGAWRGIGRRLGPAGVAAALFLVTAAAATLGSDRLLLSFIGAPQRHNGLLAYTIGLALLAVTATLPPEALARILRVLPAAAAVTAAYWLGQVAGWDPLGTKPIGQGYNENWFSSTLGNPNFAGAFVAASLVAALWALTRPGIHRDERARWGVAAGLLLAAVIGSGSLQAPIAAGGGVAVLAITLLAARSRRAAALATLAGLLAVAVVGLGLLRIGPLEVLGRQETFVSRTWDWTAAVRMTADHPLTGVGLARFGGYVRAYRPPGDILNYGWRIYADAAHSVPLDMAAGGGLPLLAAWLALIAAVGARLLRGLRTLEGERLYLLGAFGGVWTAYQAQALVSIDVVELWFLHFLSAGAILALTATTAAVPAAVAAPQRARRGVRAAVGVATLLAVLWLARHTAANTLAGRATDADQGGDTARALELNAAALRLFPWEPDIWQSRGWLFESQQDDAQALGAHLEVLRRDPRDLFSLLDAAGAARNLGRQDLADRLLRRALAVEPQAGEVKVRAASLAMGRGRYAEARRLLEAALAFDPSDTTARALLDELDADTR